MGTFSLSSPLQSGSVFGFTGDTFSPAQTNTSLNCVLYFSATVVSTNNACDPSLPDFSYTAGSGTYHVVEDDGTTTWTSNDVSYTALTPTPSPTPQVTPVIVDIASNSAIALGVHDLTIYNSLTNIVTIFILIGILIYMILRRAT